MTRCLSMNRSECAPQWINTLHCTSEERWRRAVAVACPNIYEYSQQSGIKMYSQHRVGICIWLGNQPIQQLLRSIYYHQTGNVCTVHTFIVLHSTHCPPPPFASGRALVKTTMHSATKDGNSETGKSAAP